MRQPMTSDTAFPIAQQDATDFLGGNGSRLWERLTLEMKSTVGNDESRWIEIVSGIAGQIGNVKQVLNERMLSSLDLQVYTRLLTTDSAPGKLVAIVALNSDSLIAGIRARPVGNPAESKHLDFRSKNHYRFPLNGTWTIFHGGRSVYDNYHAAFADQRFAYDIVRYDAGSMFNGDATRLEDCYGFGAPVIAIADCKVTSLEDRYEDNPLNNPSVTDPKPGNNIVLDCGGEFAMYAHLMHGSVKARAGDFVQAGQVIASVGNSGNSTSPHLHFHLQDEPTWFQGQGLPIAFEKITVNGKFAAAAEPVRGDVVQAQ